MRKFSLMGVLILALIWGGCDRDDDAPRERHEADMVSDSAGSADLVPEEEADDEGPEEGTEEEGFEPAVEALPEGTQEQGQKFTEARHAFLMDDYDRAEGLFEEIALDEPVTNDTLSAAIALSQIYVETGRPEKAVELFERLEEHVEELPEVLLVLARSYAGMGHLEQAVSAYERAYEGNPDYIFILPEVGEILLQEGEEEQASEVLLEYERKLEEMALLLEAGEETPSRQRYFVTEILALLNDDRAHEALIAALNDPEDEIRHEAIVGLREMRVEQARDPLEQVAIHDDTAAIRDLAREALSDLGVDSLHLE